MVACSSRVQTNFVFCRLDYYFVLFCLFVFASFHLFLKLLNAKKGFFYFYYFVLLVFFFVSLSFFSSSSLHETAKYEKGRFFHVPVEQVNKPLLESS